MGIWQQEIGDSIKIGLVRPFEIDYNPQDIEDLEHAIKALGHRAVNVYVDKLGITLETGRIDISQIVEKNKLDRVEIDAAFLRHLGMIKDYEQFGSRLWSVRAIEQKGVFVMNSLNSWLIASDKFAALAELAKAGLPVPKTFVSEDTYAAYNASKQMHEKVIKPLRGAMGFGVFKVDDPDMAMNVFNYFSNMNKPIYIQEYLKKKEGGDFRVVVVGGNVIGAEYRKGADWKSNVAQGGVPSAAKPDKEMREIAIKAAERLKLEYAGVDIAQTKDGYFILEVNPTMSWQGFRKATKIDLAEILIKHLVSRAKS